MPETEATCGLCGSTLAEHASLNHEFSADGRLVPKEKAKPKPVTRPLALDVVLRLLLVEKGILTSDEINGMEHTIREQLAQARGDANNSPERSNTG